MEVLFDDSLRPCCGGDSDVGAVVRGPYCKLLPMDDVDTMGDISTDWVVKWPTVPSGIFFDGTATLLGLAGCPSPHDRTWDRI